MLTGILVKIAINFEKIPYILDVIWFDWGWDWIMQGKECFDLQIGLLNVNRSLDTWELFTFTKHHIWAVGFWFETLKDGRIESVKCTIACYLLQSLLSFNSFHHFCSFSDFNFKTFTRLYFLSQRLFCKKKWFCVKHFSIIESKRICFRKTTRSMRNYSLFLKMPFFINLMFILNQQKSE